jgi:hypothetical protein
MNENRTLVRLVVLIMSVFVLLFSISGCDDAKSKAKKIVSLRSERKAMLDDLYKEYGGSEVANTIDEDLAKKQAKQNVDPRVFQGIGGFTRGIDRRVFEEDIQAVGRGESSAFFTEKAIQFFARQDVIKKAQKVYEIEIELQLLERSLDHSR